METFDAHPGRHGRVLSLQLDPEAVAMLHAIAPGRKSYGKVLSELVRREYLRKEAWQKERAEEHAALVEVGSDAE